MSGITTEVRFYDRGFKSVTPLTYSVIAARFNGEWVFVRHCDRQTWEIPGGHIENGESSMDAAIRELKEETGAVGFAIECVSTYSVTKEGRTGWGRLFFAEISELGAVRDTSEIAEVILNSRMPDSLTYPDIQPHLMGEVFRYIQD